MMRYGLYSGFGQMGLFGGLFMMLVVVAILGLLIYAAIVLLRQSRRQHGGYGNVESGYPAQGTPNPGTSSALAILDERYARGEVGDDDYNRMKSELRKL